MERLVRLGAVLAFVSLCHTASQKSVGTVVVDNGRVGIGLIAGGSFGPESFSIGGSTSGRPQPSIHVNQDDKDDHKAQQESYEPPYSGGGNTQLYPVKPLSTHVNSGQEGHRGEASSGSGQILIGTVVLNNKGNKKKNGNKQPFAPDAVTLGAIFGNSGGNDEFSNGGTSLINTGEPGSIQIGAITGGNFEEGAYSINNNNKKPGTNVPRKGIAVHQGNTNAGQETQYIKGHGVNNNGAVNAGLGSSLGQTNSGYDSESSEERWIWDR